MLVFRTSKLAALITDVLIEQAIIELLANIIIDVCILITEDAFDLAGTHILIESGAGFHAA